MLIINNPYEIKNGLWLKGNFHIHTTRSDGTLGPQDTINQYAELGHDFLSFSDHDNIMTDNEYKLLDSRNMILISGIEISAGGPHLLYIDSEQNITCYPERQKVLNEIEKIYRETGRGFAVVNHPDWEQQFNHCTIEQLMEWTGYLGMEIYNGVIGRLDGSQYATNKWDILLSKGKKVWGFANDDAHRKGDHGLGWNVVFARKKTKDAIIEAIFKGNFYCSTGVLIRHIECDGDTIYIETENAKKIAAIQNVGKRFKVVYGNCIKVEIPQDAKYVRFECWGQAEQMAWTQPFFVSLNEVAVELEYVKDWLISNLLDISGLDETNPDAALKFAKIKTACEPAGTALSGFVDTRKQSNGQDGILYLVSEVQFENDTKALLSLGYDGPIRVWLNGEEIFYGPGTNPAIRDQLKIYTRVKKGTNKLVIAFDTNGGKAWGIFCKIRPAC
ncbi:MAG TPA: CehA/McbA family metallohydrolase [bacterium]|nr:CehA/McbA family metallohydrolase [bacterium]HOL50245.1 CehA/McbA family metallohydrolase [bacterium]